MNRAGAPALYSRVNITIWTGKRANVVLHAICRPVFGGHPSDIYNVLDSEGIARRVVQHGVCPVDHKSPLDRLLVLPDPPDAVHMGMEKPEEWIVRRIEKLTLEEQQFLLVIPQRRKANRKNGC
jgi:hypothetical protein